MSTENIDEACDDLSLFDYNIEGFKKDLEHIINLHSMENMCDMPDYMMAEHICNYLRTLSGTVRARDRWFDFTPFGGPRSLPTSPEEPK